MQTIADYLESEGVIPKIDPQRGHPIGIRNQVGRLYVIEDETIERGKRGSKVMLTIHYVGINRRYHKNLGSCLRDEIWSILNPNAPGYRLNK